MSKWIAEFDLEDGDTMPEHMDLTYNGAKLDFHCRPLNEVEADACIKKAYDAGFKDGAHDGFYSDMIDDDREDSYYGRLLPTVYPKSDKLKRIEQIIADDWEKGFQHSETVARIREVLNGTD